MKKVEMLSAITEMLTEFELPLVRTGLPEHYLSVPSMSEQASMEVVREAYKWARSIRQKQYRDWVRVWKENKPSQWEAYDSTFEEVKILNNLQHSVRVACTIKSNRPRLFKKGYQDGLRKAIAQQARAAQRVKAAKAGEN